ncbi:MAG: DUF72 domain-containing protein [Gammaproteobacteria bacterium]
MCTIRIGTSGWSYDHWTGPFYPESLPGDRRLDFYAERFPTVEINNSFYRLPAEKTFKAWRGRVPGGFIFSVKASRYITHMKKLKDPSASLGKLMSRVRLLGHRLGPVLFQLPPSWKFDSGRLQDFLETLDGKPQRYAFEFRDRSWLNDRCYRMLADHGAALCVYHLAGFRSPRKLTADFTYVRLHGPGDAYQGRYDGRTLRGWAQVMSRWASDDVDVYCYFDNDEAGYAPSDALRLAAMLGLGSGRSAGRGTG